MPTILKRAGSSSATWLRNPATDPADPSDAVLTIEHWNQLPASHRLKPMLTRTYATTGEFVSQWAAAGGETVQLGTQNVGLPAWTLDGEGYPLLIVGNWPLGGSYDATLIRVGMSYSPAK